MRLAAQRSDRSVCAVEVAVDEALPADRLDRAGAEVVGDELQVEAGEGLVLDGAGDRVVAAVEALRGCQRRRCGREGEAATWRSGP